MPIIDTTVNSYINAELIRLNKERESSHTPSGKLSASMLYQPVRFQLLKTLGVPRKEFDAYTLAKFKRGVDVEEWYVEQLKGAGVFVDDTETLKGLNLTFNVGNPQHQVIYRDTIGYVDSVIDTDKMQAKKGIIPNEIKSVTNMKLRRIKKTGIDWHYKIQACDYALGMGVEYYAVTIVSAEDLRSEMHIFATAEMKRDVDHAISEYMKAMENFKEDRTLPKFEANEHVKWTGNLKYSMFAEEWSGTMDKYPDKWAIKEMEKLELL